MKKTFLVFMSILFLYSNTNAKMTNVKFEQMAVFKNISAKVLGFVPVGNTGIYKVRVKDAKNKIFEVAIDKNGEYLFLTNKIINTKTQQSIEIPIDITPLKNKELFTYGKGKEVLYVFTDPECPYCKNFEKVWSKLKDKYTLKVFFFNLPFHKKADAMSYYILGGGSVNTSANRLIEIAKGNDKNWEAYEVTENDKAKFDEILKDSKNLGSSIGVRGTPAVFDISGKSVNWSELIK